MPLRNYWSDHAHVAVRENLIRNAGGGTGVIQFNTTVPTSAHVKKLTCSGGITIRGGVSADLELLGLPMVWQSEIYMQEYGSDHYPSGRIVYLNKQAGELVTSQQSQGFQLVDFSSTSKVINSKVVTWYSGHMQPVNQSTSYGSVNQDIGVRHFGVNFYIHGVHGTTGGSDTPYYTYSCAFSLRVLYELEVAGGGIVWG